MARQFAESRKVLEMDPYFYEMLRRLKLTKKQKQDAITKYTNISKLLHSEFYDTEYNGSTKLIIGSYGKHTNIRPPQDIDLLFKIPESVYIQYEDSPSLLLQRIRNLLNKTYSTTEEIHAWGKVVLVKFTDGTHDIELLPGFDIDGVFMIPNTEDGGSWESFDVRTEMQALKDSNIKTNGLTRRLIRIIKRWSKYTKTVTIKSYRIEELCMEFLSQYDLNNIVWSSLVRDFFEWLSVISYEDVKENITQVQTAVKRSNKATQYEAEDNVNESCAEWQKVFGKKTFPSASADFTKVFNMSILEKSSKEMFIEDIYPVRINDNITVSIDSRFEGINYKPHAFAAFIKGASTISKHKSILFTATVNGISNYSLMWKTRNFGEDARANNGLRGEIAPGEGQTHKESTLYKGIHYVECYVIIDDVCVARKIQLVPIGTT